MSFVKNPIILAIIMSAVVFLILTYFCTEDNEKNEKDEKNEKNEKTEKNKKNKKKKQEKMTKESIIIVSVLAGLVTWYLSSYWLDDKDNMNKEGMDKIDVMKKQTGGGKPSEDSTKSYNLIGSGLNIPRSELKLPNVLIDYQ